MVVASQLRIQRRIILVERYSQSLSVHDIGLGASRFLRRGECQEASVAGPYGPWAKAARWLGAGVQKAQAKSSRIWNKLSDYLLLLLVTVLLPQASSSLSLDSRPLPEVLSLPLDSSYLLVNRVGLLTLQIEPDRQQLSIAAEHAW